MRGLTVSASRFSTESWPSMSYATRTRPTDVAARSSVPTGVSMVLTGALSKMGVYGAIRLLLPLFPEQVQVLQPVLLGLVVCSIVLSALSALAQSDLKRMIAYLSISHLGYCMLGLIAVGGTAVVAAADSQAALGGVFMQMFSHGVTAATLFYFAGLLEERRGSRELGDFGGLMQRTPVLCGLMSVAMFSSLGLPGLNGFIGEILIFRGSFVLVPVATALAAAGLLFTAVVLVRAMQRLFSGPLAGGCEAMPELTAGELVAVVPATVVMVGLGVMPQPVFVLFNATVTRMSHLFN